LCNRTFLFGGYEGLRLREGLTRITNVPTAAERQGDFSRSATLHSTAQASPFLKAGFRRSGSIPPARLWQPSTAAKSRRARAELRLVARDP
jgi:hypothetical protein